jgi:predicted Zn-dependent protease
MNRAKLSPELENLRAKLPDLLQTLQQNPEWYASIYLEKKSGKTFSANLKQTQISDSHSQGIVLRIYDGYTLYEQATDQTEWNALLREAKTLVERVKSTVHSKDLPKRLYPAPTWKERSKEKFVSEITSQLPADLSTLSAKTPVHFGIQFEQDPIQVPTESRLDDLKNILSRIQSLAPKAGLEVKDLNFIVARESISAEEAIFIDTESNLSQALYRVSLTVGMMSGSDRSFERFGGLGGREAISLRDEKLLSMLESLKSLKTAEALVPGKHRVIFSPTLSGVLAHEAFGHSQEGDTCARGRSKAWDLHLSGETVGNEHATILNNPAIFKNATESSAAWGSYFFDEEGWIATEQVILDKGVLNSPMTNLTSAIRLGVPRSANGKRESWEHGVYTRQTNTYFSAGKKTLKELMEKMGDGYLGLNAAGGMEDPKGMGIQVGIQYLKEVKNGKLTGRVFKGPAGGDIQLTGYVPDVLGSIIDKSKIEADLAADDTAEYPFNDCGGCGKYHKEIVYAGCGGPYLLLDNVILG